MAGIKISPKAARKAKAVMSTSAAWFYIGYLTAAAIVMASALIGLSPRTSAVIGVLIGVAVGWANREVGIARLTTHELYTLHFMLKHESEKLVGIAEALKKSNVIGKDVYEIIYEHICGIDDIQGKISNELDRRDE